MRRATALLVTAFVAAAGACGGSDDTAPQREAVERVIRGYLAAVAVGDGPAACAYLTENAQLGVFEFERVHAGTDHPAEACARVVERTAFRAGRERLRDPRIEDVDVDGDRASARVEGFAVSLERAGGRWRIAIFGLAGDVAGEVLPQ